MDSSSGDLLYGGLIQGSDGRFYGTAAAGGLFGCGCAYRLSVPLATTLSLKGPPTAATFSWRAVVGQSYQVQACSDPTSGHWNNVGPAIVPTNSFVTASDPNPTGAGSRFYRVFVQ